MTSLILGTVAGQAIVLLVTPLLTRIYSTKEFGRYGALASAESLIVVVALLRLDKAINAADSDDEANSIARAACVSALIVSVGFVVILLVTSVETLVLDKPVGPVLALIFGMAVVSDAGYVSVQHLAVRARRYVAVGRTKGAVGAGQAAGQLASVPLGGAEALLAGWTVGRVLGLLAERRVWPRKAADGASVLGVVRAHRRFPLVLLPAAVLNVASLQAPVLLLANSYGVETAGIFVLASRVLMLPTQLISQSAAQLFAGEVRGGNDIVALRRTLLGMQRRVGVIAVVIGVAVLVSSPYLIGPIFGSEWSPAAEFVTALAPAMALQLVVAPFAYVLVLTERERQQLAWDVVRFGVVIATLLIPAAADWSAVQAVRTLSLGLVAMYVVLFGLERKAVRRPVELQ